MGNIQMGNIGNIDNIGNIREPKYWEYGRTPHEKNPFIIIWANPSRKNTLFCGCARLNIENMGEPLTKNILIWEYERTRHPKITFLLVGLT